MRSFSHSHHIIEQVFGNIEKVLIGKRSSIERFMIAVLAGGHVLLEDVPGVGKTLLVKAFAKSVDCDFRRIQFTPDLMPSDVTGVSVFHPKSSEFVFRPGPIDAHLVIADELNRASPRTQAAMLEAMEERAVTVDGTTRTLPSPFIVLATQNPLESEGTYPLPEAQLDRFLLRLSLGYPARDEEIAMLGRTVDGRVVDKLRPVVLREELVQMQRYVRDVYVDDSVKRYIVELSHATRVHPDVQLGASPRASQALMNASQAAALLAGRGFVLPDDVKRLVPYVFGHRIVFAPHARIAGTDAASFLEQLTLRVAVPAVPAARAN